jgi:MYXO-CTERM domain-containing protein
MSFVSRITAAGLLAGMLSIAPVHAQQTPNAQQDTTTSNATTPNTGIGTVTRYDDRRGFDWGWLGLLGLLGLFGLRKPTNVVYQDRDRTYQDRTTTR